MGARGAVLQSRSPSTPPPENKVWGYAHYKLGYVYWNKGDFARAMSEFKKTIEYGAAVRLAPQRASSSRSRRGATSSRSTRSRAIPSAPTTSSSPLSGDSGGSTEKTFKMMDDLGQNYLDTGHYPEGIALYTDLMTRDRGPKYCVYQGHIAGGDAGHEVRQQGPDHGRAQEASSTCTTSS